MRKNLFNDFPMLLLRLYLSCLMLVLPAVSSAQDEGTDSNAKDFWTVLTPMPDAVVEDQELLIMAQMNPRMRLHEASVRVFIDGRYITNNVQIEDNYVKVLYLIPLKPGQHKIEIHGGLRGSLFVPPLVWYFNVPEPVKGKTNPDSTYKRYQVQGRLLVDHRTTNLSGSGIESRQEPPVTNIIQLDAEARAGNIRMPVHIRHNSDQYNYPQGVMPRNYYQVGLNTRSLNFRVGDMNPYFDPLIMSGVRIRGWQAGYTRRRFSISILNGTSAQANEGALAYFEKGSGLTPSHLQADSSFILPGRYQRQLSSLRLTFGTEQEESQTGITFLRGHDRPKSIQYGHSPGDNFVFGIDQKVYGADRKFSVRGAFAYSFHTSDISGGALTKAKVDSIMDIDFPIDPEKWSSIFIFNETTTKPTKAAVAGQISTTIQGKWHSTTLDYKYLGSNYISYGNPFQRVDTRSGGIEEELRFFKRQLLLNGYLRHEHNNLIFQQLATTYSYFYGGSVIYSPGINMPRLMVAYRAQQRDAAGLEKYGRVSDQTNTFHASLYWPFQLFGWMHNLHGTFTDINRESEFRPYNSFSMQMLNLGLTENIKPINLFVDLRYYLTHSFTEATDQEPLGHYLEGRVRYQLPVKYFQIHGTYGKALNESGILGLSSSRNRFSAGIRGMLRPEQYLEIEAGSMPYVNYLNDQGDYDEFYISARLVLPFDFGIQ